jgi:hypothetical protein
MDNGLTIRLMYGSANFAETSLPANVTTVAHLKQHLGNVPANASVNIDQTVVMDDNTVLTDGASVAIVASNKTGG